MTRNKTNLYSRNEKTPPESIIFGRSGAMADIRRSIREAAETDIPVLIEGESGTGKEIISRHLHRLSFWGAGPFVKVSCPAIRGTLLETELFECTRSSPSEEASTKRVQLVQSGTLFLDEIFELHASRQLRLVEAMQESRLTSIACTPERNISARRLICSTSCQLNVKAIDGDFHKDLYDHIAGMILRLPPLRERLEDLADLADYFVGHYNEQFKCCAPRVSNSSLLVMENYSWPGNVRELENLIERYVVLGTEEAILSEIRISNGAADHPIGEIACRVPDVAPWKYERRVGSINVQHRPRLCRPLVPAVKDNRDCEPSGTEQNILRTLQ